MNSIEAATELLLASRPHDGDQLIHRIVALYNNQLGSSRTAYKKAEIGHKELDVALFAMGCSAEKVWSYGQHIGDKTTAIGRWHAREERRRKFEDLQGRLERSRKFFEDVQKSHAALEAEMILFGDKEES